MKKLFTFLILLNIVLVFSSSLLALPSQEEHAVTDSATVSHQASQDQEGTHGSGLGTELPLWSVIPFIGILLSIAIFPLIAPHFWHHHFGKISAFWALLFAIPFLIAYGGDGMYEILHIYIADYIPFIILLWALFTAAGGIYIQGAPVGTPYANLVVLLIGTILASWIGTTGAAMVLIRPVIRMNKYRKSKVHIIVFFIFLVANIGGSLTPLGDPPLFLGFLHHVPFFWTLKLLPEMAMLSGILLVLFFLMDIFYFRKEGWHNKPYLKPYRYQVPEGMDEEQIKVNFEKGAELTGASTSTGKVSIQGLHNIIFLLGIMGGVLFSGLVHIGEFSLFGVHVTVQSVIRDVFLILMGLLSLKTTAWSIREGNEFTWFPIQEVAKLFAGIFMTIVPALAMLRAGAAGHLGFIIEAVTEPWHYFWVTGSLSSFLDNAPTYLTFLSTSLGQFFAGQPEIIAVGRLIAEQEIYLKAISTGAVFYGAMTYIGNAPNFMVKSISEEQNIKMPSFFGYMIYSVLILVPIFVLITLVFF
ncbi:MAG: sodium:proton antiporter [bacterium]|nr:MAG: sodium:proton antiporter [bacterium]